MLCGVLPLAVPIPGLKAPQRERTELPPVSLLALHTDCPAALVLGHDYALAALKFRLRHERVRPDSNNDARPEMTVRLRVRFRLTPAVYLRHLTPAACLRLRPPRHRLRLLRVLVSRRLLTRPPKLHAAPRLRQRLAPALRLHLRLRLRRSRRLLRLHPLPVPPLFRLYRCFLLRLRLRLLQH